MGLISIIGSIFLFGTMGIGVMGISVYSYRKNGIHGIINLICFALWCVPTFNVVTRLMNLMAERINNIGHTKSISYSLSDLFTKSFVHNLIAIFIILVIVFINTTIMHIKYDDKKVQKIK